MAGTDERKKRLSVRLTARGWQSVVIGVLILVLARLFGTTQLYQLAYILLLIPLSALVVGFFGARRVEFSRKLLGGRVVAAEPARVELALLNGSRLGISASEVSDNLPERRLFEFEPLRSGEGTARSVEVSFGRRGVYGLGPAEVSVAGPFGMVRFSSLFTQRTEVVVYPRVHELGLGHFGSGSDSGGRGVTGQRGDEFAALREYRRGDDRRHIHWKSLARTGDLYVKEFALHSPRRYTVALDLRRGGLRAVEGPVEDAVSAAASVLTRLGREGLPARLVCANASEDSTDFATDDASYWKAMRMLARVRADGTRTLSETVGRDAASLGEGVVLVSRSLEDGLAERVRGLRAGGLSVAAILVAAHTYTPTTPNESAAREAAFLRYAENLERAGASVHLVRNPEGVGGLSGGRSGGFVFGGRSR